MIVDQPQPPPGDYVPLPPDEKHSRHNDRGRSETPSSDSFSESSHRRSSSSRHRSRHRSHHRESSRHRRDRSPPRSRHYRSRSRSPRRGDYSRYDSGRDYYRPRYSSNRRNDNRRNDNYSRPRRPSPPVSITEPLNPIQEMEIKARTLFVTRLHYRVSKSQLSEFFEQNGLAVKKVSLITDKSSGRSKGMAYVELCKYDDVEKGVALNGTVLEGIHMEIQRVAVQTEAQSALFDILASTTAIPAIQPDLGLKLTGTSSVVISNVHPRITRDEIQTIFKTFGDVVGLKEIEVPQDPPPETTRNGPNKAWQVEFAVVESADDAVLVLDGKEIGTIVKVQHKIDWDRDRSDQNHTSF